MILEFDDDHCVLRQKNSPTQSLCFSLSGKAGRKTPDVAISAKAGMRVAASHVGKI